MTENASSTKPAKDDYVLTIQVPDTNRFVNVSVKCPEVVAKYAENAGTIDGHNHL